MACQINTKHTHRDSLLREYQGWLIRNRSKLIIGNTNALSMSADELLFDLLDQPKYFEDEIAYLQDFIERWGE